MKRFVLAFSMMLFVADVAQAQYQPPALNSWKESSPDGHFLAATRIIPDDVMLWNTDMDTGRLVVLPLTNGGLDKYVSYDFARLIAHIEWSPDSQFIVMTTVNAGGHSPWHYCAYVYCVADKSLRYMDDVVGLVVDDKFKFVGPHSVTMQIAGPGPDTDNPVSVTLDLAKKVPQMKKQDGMKEGKI